MTALSGERSSWLIARRNLTLLSFACAASRLASSISSTC